MSLSPHSDTLGMLGDAGTPVRVERIWTGTEVAFRVSLGDACATLTVAEFAAFSGTADALLEDAAEYATTRKREHCPPTRFGLVLRAESPTEAADEDDWSYSRPDRDETDPYVEWKDPADPSWSSDPHPGRWELRVPAANYYDDVPPLGKADWNDEAGIGGLCEMAQNPEGCWTLFAMAYPEAAADHQQTLAVQAEGQARYEARAEMARYAQEGWAPFQRKTAVSGEALQRRLRAAHVGDTGLDALFFRALPMDPEVLVKDPEIAERSGFTGRFVDAYKCVGTDDKGSKDYPVAGWLMHARLGHDTSPKEAAQWAARVAAVLPRDLRVVHRRDGWWVIRDEHVFDLLHGSGQPAGRIVEIKRRRY